MSQKVVYVSYGTNMDTDRFMAYIVGGGVEGAKKIYDGCRDKTPPTHKLVLASDAHQGYFSRNSSVWGETPYNEDGSENFGGLGLVGTKADKVFNGLDVIDPKVTRLQDLTRRGALLLAGYVISFEQFSDVMKQENKKAMIDVNLPEVLIDSLSLENPVLDLRKRVGEDAIVLPNGDTIEIDITGAYSALMYLGEVEVDGEMVKAVTFTSPFNYERAAAQTYLNMYLSNIPPGFFERAQREGLDAIEKVMPGEPADKLHRLNPGTAAYVDMVASGIEELGGGHGDWTREQAVEYALTQPPFDENQFPGLKTMVRESLGLDGKGRPDLSDFAI